jgi:outer membrane protein assembly factor BamB
MMTMFFWSKLREQRSGKHSITRATILLATLLSACGGGGGSSGGGGNSGGPLALSVTPNPVKATYFQTDLPGTISLNGTLLGNTSGSSLYVAVVDSGDAFAPVAIATLQPGAGSYQATLTTAANLSVGTHTGQLNMEICSDAQCKSVATSSSVPYTITLNATPTVTVTASPKTLTGTAITIGSGASAQQVASFDVPAFTASGTLPDPVYVEASDADGVMELAPPAGGWSGPQIVGPLFGNPFQLTFAVAKQLTAGEYKGTIQFSFCEDAACAKLYNGTTKLSYDLTVSAGNQTTLSPLTGAADWVAPQGDNSHTGYVAATVDPSNISLRWMTMLDASAMNTSFVDSGSMVTAGNKVFVVHGPASGGTDETMFALGESDGSQAWQKTRTSTTAQPLALASGKVYLPWAASLDGLNTSNGSTAFSITTSTSSPNAIPVAESGEVLYSSNGPISGALGNYDQVNAYDGQSGALDGAPTCLKQQESSSGFAELPEFSVDTDLTAYVTTNSGLLMVGFGKASFCTLLPLGLNFAFAPGATVYPPILVPSSTFVVLYGVAGGGSGYIVFDTSVKAAVYSTSASFYAPAAPALSSDAVYFGRTQDSQVDALKTASGKPLWSWLPPQTAAGVENSIHGNLVVTKNLLFVSTDSHIYAIDTSTHQTVWSLSIPGSMAISSNGILYVNDGGLLAINLH